MVSLRRTTAHASCGAWARFDDLITGSAIRCADPDQVLVADRPADVLPVLTQVQQATEAGRWAFGYVAYEAAAGLGTGLTVHQVTPFGMPLAWFGICDRPSVVPVVEPLPPDAPAHDAGISWRPGWTAAAHAGRVAVIKDRIAAGDTYQCNLTERMTGRLGGDPYEFYRDIALGQRGAYNAYLDLGRFVIASASPELFFEWRSGDLTLRPMKGTARRGRFLGEDRERAEELRGSAKERAENLMIVDLMRNDLSRIAEVGTVAVPALFSVERYGSVLQLTSEVTGRLRPGVGLAELFSALFPCGSVTGAPKASSMEILRSVEPEPRGVYCGAIGLVGPHDQTERARFSVAIRTAVIDTSTGQALYGTGGGITWDSEPAAEHAEIEAKAAVLGNRAVAFQLLETMRAQGSRIWNRDLHLQRMADSADHLGFRFDRSAVLSALREQVSDGDELVRVRLLLNRDGTFDIGIDPIPPGPPVVVLELDDEPVDPGQWWLYHKTTLRAEYDRRRDRHPGADDVVMINVDGDLTEVTRATLGVEIDGRWWTPPLTAGCLPGVERDRLITAGRLRERQLQPTDLIAAREIALISSLRGWRRAELRGSAHIMD